MLCSVYTELIANANERLREILYKLGGGVLKGEGNGFFLLPFFLTSWHGGQEVYATGARRGTFIFVHFLF
jgi:hypothetical protein